MHNSSILRRQRNGFKLCKRKKFLPAQRGSSFILKLGEDFRWMRFGLLDPGPMPNNFALRPDNDRGTNRSSHLLAVHHLVAEAPYFFMASAFGSDSKVNGSLYLTANLLCDSTLSLLMPNTTALLFFKDAFKSRKPHASCVHPGLSSLG